MRGKMKQGRKFIGKVHCIMKRIKVVCTSSVKNFTMTSNILRDNFYFNNYERNNNNAALSIGC